ANSASAIFCCGRRPIRDSSSRTRSGPISARPTSRRRWVSTIAANAATVPPLAPPAKPAHALRLRILSALALGPPVLALVWLRGPFLDALMLVAVGVMGWEWARLVGRGGIGATALAVIVTGVGAMGTLVLGEVGTALLVAAGGSALVALLARLTRSGSA